MRVVEFLGPPGSGKSTLVADLVPLVPDAVALEQAVRSSIARRGEDPLTRLIARLGRGSEGRLWNAAYARSTDRFSALTRFLSVNPRALDAVTSLQQARADRDIEPAVVRDWIFNLMARYQLAVEEGSGRWLAIDEGFAQRGVALLAGGFLDEDLELVGPYLDAVPSPELVVVVDTPLDVCEERLDRKGWSTRLHEADAPERRRFLEGAAAAVDRISSRLESSGVQVIRVSGTRAPADSVREIAARFPS